MMAQQTESMNASVSGSQCPRPPSSSRRSTIDRNDNGKTANTIPSYPHYADDADHTLHDTHLVHHDPDQTMARYTDAAPDESTYADHHSRSPNSSPRLSISSFDIDDTVPLHNPHSRPRTSSFHRPRLRNRNRLLPILLTISLILILTSVLIIVVDHHSQARNQERRAYRRAVCEMRDGGERCRLLEGWARCVAERDGGREECARRVRERGEGVIGLEGVYDGL